MPATPSLFHPRTLKKALAQHSSLKDGQIPAAARKVLEEWQNMITDGSIHKQNEKKLQPEFFRDLCGTVLGYKSFSQKDKRSGQWTLGYEESSGRGFSDICFGHFSDKEKQRLAPFELKDSRTNDLDVPMLGRKLSTVAQAAQYAENSKGEARWYLVSNCIEIRLYKYPFSNQVYESWQIANLIQPAEYDHFVLLLGAKSLLSGATEKLFEQSQQAEKDITNELYADYRDIRVKLINGMKRENGRFSRQSMVARAQTLLDRVLFIAFAEDRDLLPAHTLQTYISAKGGFDTSWDMLKRLFRDVNDGNRQRDIPRYNGDLFKPDEVLEELSISDELLNELQRLWAYDFDTDVNVTILGHIFEQSIADLDQIYESLDEHSDLQLVQQKHGTSGKRKQDGVVYTPDFITTWIVQKTLGDYLDKRKQEISAEAESLAWWQTYRDILATTRILDPACGSGAFLVAAFQYLKQEYALLNQRLQELGDEGDLFGRELNHDILNNNLFGVDINAESVEIARLSLHLATAEKGKPLTSLRDNIKQGNSIVDDKSVDKGAFNWFGRFKEFDVILGNPPYVRQERLTPIKPYLETHYQTYHGVADLYTYFFELGLRLLKKGGMLGYISSGTFFRTGSGENLRRFLAVESNLKTVVDFGDLQVFEGVTTYPAILIMEKPSRVRKQAPAQAFQFLNVQSTHVSQLTSELREASFGEMPQNKLALDGWRLEDERLQALRAKLTKGKRTLKEVYSSPLYGIKTGLMNAFVIDQETYQKLVSANPQSLDRLKPFLEGKDLKKWRAESRKLYLVLFPKGWTRQQIKSLAGQAPTETQAWEWLKHQYPAICEWLEPFAERGRKRSDQGEFWWELRACAYYDEFDGNKIIYPDITDRLKFSFDSKAYLFETTGFFIKQADQFLCGLLNSEVVWFFLRNMCPQIRGGFSRLKTIYMETVPVPEATEEQKQAIAELAESCQTLAEQRYALENGFRRRIPDLCPKDREAKLSQKLQAWWEMDFAAFRAEVKKVFKQDIPFDDVDKWEGRFDKDKAAIQSLGYQLTVKEQALNQAVYALFGLDEVEIKLLEESLA
ncbi:Eco57I restriction-modification methylase domain-containing protein [Thiothrix nivea]|uniref:site-specific DNA-methyltransferase (adenine-specific) n=1 Tax=Thiothrix nivea (strain ATCC 35100 / DSM 5205 / JP2) TaxID=870187 RepID=A0A656HC32_THINJ|nr:N-6 DNA methylase [Thiothrix nivea]EIJ33020.1 N-6 DNA methylase [Thiothrix nivea DSM 5205]